MRAGMNMGSASMDDMIARVSEASGVAPEVTQRAVGEIFAFLQREASPEAMAELMEKLPGAAELTASMGGAAPPIGGIVGLAGNLMGLGLGMAEMQAIGREVLAYARVAAGEETLNKVASSVPALAALG